MSETTSERLDAIEQHLKSGYVTSVWLDAELRYLLRVARAMPVLLRALDAYMGDTDITHAPDDLQDAVAAAYRALRDEGE